MYNVRGLGEGTKRRQVFYFLHKKQVDVAFLQETHSVTKTEKLWKHEWEGKIWYSHGNSQLRGVAICVSKNINLQVHNVIWSNDGRYLILYATFLEKKWLLVNIYAPNKDEPSFFTEIMQRIDRFSPDHTLIAGDLNLALDCRMDRLGTANNNNAANCIRAALENRELVDV